MPRSRIDAPAPSVPLREPLLVKLFFAGRLTAEALRGILQSELSDVNAGLAERLWLRGLLEMQRECRLTVDTLPGEPDARLEAAPMPRPPPRLNASHVAVRRDQPMYNGQTIRFRRAEKHSVSEKLSHLRFIPLIRPPRRSSDDVSASRLRVRAARPVARERVWLRELVPLNGASRTGRSGCWTW